MSAPVTRKTEILSAAIQLAESEGLNEMNRDQVAAVAKCSTGLVNLYFGTMKQLRRAVIGEAVRTKNLNVIAQALVLGDPRAKRAPDELKREALASVLE